MQMENKNSIEIKKNNALQVNRQYPDETGSYCTEITHFSEFGIVLLFFISSVNVESFRSRNDLKISLM